MGNNSTYRLQDIVADARRMGDCAPAIPTGGASDQIATSIANDVMAAMVQGGPNGEPMNPKWNRIYSSQYGTPGSFQFPTISYQQDYAQNIVNLGWMERAWMIDINSTMNPKRKVQLTVKRELEEDYVPGGWQAKICSIQNNQQQYGRWGQSQIASQQGITNPGPNVVYTNPVGTAGLTPANPTTQIIDPNGNFWYLTTFGTCGATQPTWPTVIAFPTLASPTTAATTVNDGTCVWTALNPQAYGFRLDPIPSQTSLVWLIMPILQAFPVKFTSLNQTLDPLPDMWVTYFKTGFFAMCHQRNPDPKIRARYAQEYPEWLKALDKAVKAGLREPDDFGFYPERSIMDTGSGYTNFGAAWPYPGSPWGF